MQKLATSMAAALLFAFAGSAARADDDETDRLARDRVLASVQKGEIKPLGDLKRMVLARWPGELLDVEINEEHGILAYSFKVVTSSGRLTEIEVDAKTGQVIEVENE